MATPSPTKPKLRRFLLARHGETNFNKEHRIQGIFDASVLTSDGRAQAIALGRYIARRQAGEVKDNNNGDASSSSSTTTITTPSSSSTSSSSSVAAAPSITRTWCSPLRRCRQTYEVVSYACSSDANRHLHHPPPPPLPAPTIHNDLREIELCEWQGRLRQEIIDEDTHNWNVFKRDPKMLRLRNGTFAPVVDCWERGARNWDAIRSDDVALVQNDADSEEEEAGCGATFIMAHGAIGQCMLLHAIGLPLQNYGKCGIRYSFDNCECVEMEWADGEEYCRRWRWAHISSDMGGKKKSEWMDSAASRMMDGGDGLSCGR